MLPASTGNDKLSLDTFVPIADADIHPRDANIANDFFRGTMSLTFRLLQIGEPKPFIGERAVVIEFQIEIIQWHFWKMQNEANGFCSMDETPQVIWQAQPRQAAFIRCPSMTLHSVAHAVAASRYCRRWAIRGENMSDCVDEIYRAMSAVKAVRTDCPNDSTKP
jgi:hypothetical protein